MSNIGRAAGGRRLCWGALLVVCLFVGGTATGSAMSSPTSVTQGAGACSAPADATTITLSDSDPTPTATVSTGTALVVIVPPWSGDLPTPPRTSTAGLLAQRCTTVLPDHSGVTVLVAVAPGETDLFATVTPASNLMMPAWLGDVVVRG